MKIDELEENINRSIKFVAFISLVIPFLYGIWFCWQGSDIAIKPEAWGQFGDYVGGILNPFIAFSAFYWLATSVRLQKIELSETRSALEASQHAQEKQAQAMLVSTQLQFFNIQLEAINSQLLAERAYVNELVRAAQTHGLEYTIVTDTCENKHLNSVMPDMKKNIAGLELTRNKLINQMKSISPDLIDTSVTLTS